MAKRTRNSGILRQDSVVNQFYRDARSDQSGSAVAQCIGKTKEKKEKVRISRNHLAGNV